MINVKALALAVVLSFTFGCGVGWYVKSKFYKAAEWAEMKASLFNFGIEAQDRINEQDKKWNLLVADINEELQASTEARNKDSLAAAETARTLKETSDAIKKISRTIPLVDNVGVCMLTDDFIRVWNDLKEASDSRRTGTEG